MDWHQILNSIISEKSGFLDEYKIDNNVFENGSIPKTSKLMLRKNFVVSKTVVIKKMEN